MTGAGLAKIIGKKIRLTDPRTGHEYQATVVDAKHLWGKTRVKVTETGNWFEPTNRELDSCFETCTFAYAWLESLQ
jgi:hypothetical protein